MPYIKGIVNLRSEVIPVYSLKKKFGLVDNGVSENTIIIDTKNVKLALEVDEVVEIGDIEPENIVPMPEIALNAQTQYMPRVANVDGNLIILLDVTELLSEEEEAVVKQMAEDMKRNNGFIPGIKPGKNTAEYIDAIMSRITLPGSIFLALVAIMPAFAGIFGVKAEFAQFFGGTSLLILVGVVLDTLQQVESHLLMRHYDGLLNSGRIKGRAGNVAAY